MTECDAEARYHPSRDQLALVEAFEDSIAALLPIARLHDGAEESGAVWEALAGLGLFEMAEGLGAVEEAMIVLGLGRRLAAPSVLATIGAGHGRVAGLGRVASGWRTGERVTIVAAPGAGHALVREGESAAIHAMPGDARPLDAVLWLAELVTGEGLGDPVARIEGAGLLRLRLNDAAVLAGIADAALAMALGYTGMREQFGRPIGSFQAIKHHCANMAIAARAARDQVSFAAVALDDGRADAALQVESALLVAAEAAIGNAGLNIQIHGGIGFSDEADPHLVLKRARLFAAIASGAEAAAVRIARLPAA